ncbi:MAG: 4-alpha-glucanotransferase, partial [Nitrospinota bacterium]
GDIPYLVGRDSADVWANREYFNMNISAGAPPDMFSTTGQKWGVPTYNWDSIKNRNYEWYRLRLKQAENYFDLYRIDHAVGIYRIFSIDQERPDGSIGVFDPENSSTWEEHGETLIKMMLDSTSMLPIAEDLGVVPDCVRPNLKKLGVPRTIVERWERNYEGDGSFVKLSDVEPVAMNTVSTHDTETLRQWWRDNPEERARFAEHLHLQGPPPETLTPEIHQQIIERSLNSSCLFTINLPQDIFRSRFFSENPDIHRINVPATVSRANWSYYFPLPMEDLVCSATKEIEAENARIRKLNERSGRC